MRKIRMIMLSLAVVAAAGAAMATASKNTGSRVTQYYKVGNNYYPAGIEGYDYECQWDHWGTCTYYRDERTGAYIPSKAGKIVWIR